MAQRVAEAYMADYPNRRIVLNGGGTQRGYKSVIDGSADIALASGPVSPELQKEADRSGMKLVNETAAYMAIVAVVHPSNPLSGLTRAQLKKIFSGRAGDWGGVGGRPGAINVLVGPPSGGVTEVWKETILGEDATFTPKGIVMDARQRIAAVAADPSAITFVAFGSVLTNVKTLAVDGVAANPQTLADSRYPLRAALMLAATDKASPAAKDFIRYFSLPHKGMQFAGMIKASQQRRTEARHE